MLKLVRWDDNARNHDPLHMSITNLTELNQNYPHHSLYPFVHI
jgi:hypothetical protein